LTCEILLAFVMQMHVEMDQHDSGLLSIKNCFIASHDQAEGGNTIANTVTVIFNLLISNRILQNTPWKSGNI